MKDIYQFLGNGSNLDGYNAWYRFARINPKKLGLSGSYAAELKVFDSKTKNLIGKYKITLKKEADEELFSLIKIQDLIGSSSRKLNSAIYKNELWLSSDQHSYMTYKVNELECLTTEAFDLLKVTKNTTPDVKAVFVGAITLSNLEDDEFSGNNDIESFGGLPYENFVFGDTLKKTKVVVSLDEIKASGFFSLKKDGVETKLVTAVSTAEGGSDDMLFFILDKASKAVSVLKRIDGDYEADVLNDLVTKWNGTTLDVSTDGGKTFTSKNLIGPSGKRGKTPAHRWSGTYLQLENEDGTFGEMINLLGPVPEAQFNEAGTSVRFKQEKGWTDWWTIKGVKGDMPGHRYLNSKGEEIEDAYAYDAQGDGIFINFQRPEGGWSTTAVNVIGPRPQHRYLEEDGVTVTTNHDSIFYIQFQNADGSWGQKAKVIGMDGVQGKTPNIIRYDAQGKRTEDPDLTEYVAFEEQDPESGEIKEGVRFRVQGKRGFKGVSPTVAFARDGKLVVTYGEEGKVVTSESLYPVPFWNGTTLKFQLGFDDKGAPIYSNASNLVGPTPIHEYDAEKKLIRFMTPTGFGEWLDFRGPKGDKGDKGDIIDHKVEKGNLYFQTPTGEWGNPISFRVNYEKKVENEIVYIRFYNEINGLDTGWIPVTTVTIPTTLNPLLHVLSTEDLYPGAAMPSGYIERLEQEVKLNKYPILKQILLKNGLIKEGDSAWKLDSKPGSFVKVEYAEELFNYIYPEGTVIAKSNPSTTPFNDPAMSAFNWEKTYLLEEGVELEDFVTYKRMMKSVKVPETISETIGVTEASFQFASPQTHYELQDVEGKVLVAENVGVQAVFKELYPNTSYMMVYSVRDNEDSAYSKKSRSFMTSKDAYLNAPENLTMIENTSDSITVTADSIDAYGIAVAAEITCIETGEVLESPAKFESLEVGTYTFKARYPENKTNLPSGYTAETSFDTLKKERTIVPVINGDPSTAISSIDADTLVLDLPASSEDGTKVFFSVAVGAGHPDAINEVIEGEAPLTINNLTAETSYVVTAYYKEATEYYGTAESDKVTFEVTTLAKGSSHAAPTGVNIAVYDSHIKVEAKPYKTSDGEEVLAKVTIKENGQSFYADGKIVKLDGYIGGGDEAVTVEVFYEENREIAQSEIHSESLVTIPLAERTEPVVTIGEVTAESIMINAQDATEDGKSAIIKESSTGKVLENPAKFDGLKPGIAYDFVITYGATHEYLETVVTKQITTLKLDRVKAPVLTAGEITDAEITISSPESEDDGAIAQITCVETSEKLASPATFKGLNADTEYKFVAEYEEGAEYNSIASEAITVATDVASAEEVVEEPEMAPEETPVE